MRPGHTNQQKVAVLTNRHLFDEHGCRLFLWIVIAERLEVVHAHKLTRSGLHRRKTERLLDPPHKRLREGRPAPRELIEITAGDSGMPGVKAVWRLDDGEDVDVVRQFVVQAPAQR